MRSFPIFLNRHLRRTRLDTGFPATREHALSAEEANTLRAILPHVPTTFTTVSQVGRALSRQGVLPDATRDAAAVERYAKAYPAFFEMQVVGSVATVRRRASALAAMAEHLTKTCSTRMLSPPSCSPSSRDLALSDADVATLTHVFPSFCIPLSALASAPSLLSEDVKALIDRYRPHLVLHTPYCAARAWEAADTVNDPVPSSAYVSLSKSFVYRYTDCSVTTAADARWEAWRVEEYEWLRVARLFPTTQTWVPLTADLVAAAQPLLPSGRDILHVLLSAPPSLFDVTPYPNDPKTPHNDGPQPVYVRFQLNRSSFAQVSMGDVEALQTELAHLHTRRFEKGVRRRRRELQRQLTYLLKPTPLLDERVLAQYLFDQLPAAGSVPVQDLLGNLPDAVRHCLPPDLAALWHQRDDLFHLHHVNSAEMMIQRADARLPISRATDSVDAMEILQEVYHRYPLAHHPDEGTCMFRVLPKLSPLVRDRLFQLRDVEELVLRRFPNKIEVLDMETQLMARQLTTCKGRTDFFVSFRFVGEWQTCLVRRFETSMAKRTRHRHSSRL